ncbi:MAG TPA: mechanosensitive ion channel family protein [Nitriliruptorales bacterium]|nr:mechanosensitive ion channel family protein [Nitriliruptorales bacterium]
MVWPLEVTARGGGLQALARAEVAAQDGGTVVVSPSPTEPLLMERDVDDFAEALELVRDTVESLVAGFLAHLPLIAVGVALFLLGLLVARWVGTWTERGLRRTSADAVVIGLSGRLARFVTVLAFALLALAIAGVKVGAALATLGIAGLALAFALQNILENFVAGVILMVRKPFRAGDQIQTGEFEGTVEEIDLRVTRLQTYDGVTVLMPNADVFRNPLCNLTRRGRRRTTVTVGIDYRDDHDRAREVLMGAVRSVPAVLENPEPEVLLTELGDSSVDFELRYWTLPDIRSVRHAQDRVLSAAKSAVAEAGMTIPWPIRTLSFDNAVRVRGDGARQG